MPANQLTIWLSWNQQSKQMKTQQTKLDQPTSHKMRMETVGHQIIEHAIARECNHISSLRSVKSYIMLPTSWHIIKLPSQTYLSTPSVSCHDALHMPMEACKWVNGCTKFISLALLLMMKLENHWNTEISWKAISIGNCSQYLWPTKLAT